MKMVTVACQNCGKEFQKKEWFVERGRGKYCSRACFYIGNNQRVTVPCAYCGKPITRSPSGIHTDEPCCSVACSSKHAADKRKPNVRFEGDIVLIPLSQDQWAQVDRADYDAIPLLHEHWSAVWSDRSKTFYAVRKQDGVNVRMHRVITGAPEEMEVNHWSNDGTDNRRENLIVCTPARHGLWARKKARPGSPSHSKYKGVTRYAYSKPDKPRWIAIFRHKKLGIFETEEAAARAWNAEAAAFDPLFSKLNDVD